MNRQTLHLSKLARAARIVAACASAATLLAACGGSGSDSALDESLDGETMALGWRECSTVPSVKTSTATVRSVREFGATGDDDTDDAPAIQRALDTLNPGETLWFPAGRYRIGKSVKVRRPGITISGDNPTLHGTNPDDQAILIEADDTTISGLTFTAVTDVRRSAPRHARIAVLADLGKGQVRTVYNTVIVNNRVVNGGAPGTPLANGASATGFFIYRAENFLIAHNTVVRTLADGIHITGGSRYGRVLDNTVKETGDDMVAVVSYAGSGEAALDTAASLKAQWDSRVEQRLVRDIFISGNTLSGQYWGRGISVVGGRNVTIVRNRLDNIPYAAPILLAREANYESFGVANVRVEDNVVRDVQTQKPPYDPFNKWAGAGRTGHGAVEVQSAQFTDEMADAWLSDQLAVKGLLIRGNTVERSAVNAFRAGTPMNGTMTATTSGGATISRQARTGPILDVTLQNNRLNAVTTEPFSLPGSTMDTSRLHCTSNLRDGAAYQPSVCKAKSAPTVTGAALNCTSAGVRII